MRADTMIKLKNLIQEYYGGNQLDDLLEYINNPPCKKLIFRGDRNLGSEEFDIRRITTRELKDTKEISNDMIEKYKNDFNIKFPNRKKCIFATTNLSTAEFYGYPCVIFPINCDIYYNIQYIDSITITGIGIISGWLNIRNEHMSEVLNKLKKTKNAENIFRLYKNIFENKNKKNIKDINLFENINFKKLIAEVNYLITNPLIFSSHRITSEFSHSMSQCKKSFEKLSKYFKNTVVEKDRIYKLQESNSNIELLIDGEAYLIIDYEFFIEHFHWYEDKWEITKYD